MEKAQWKINKFSHLKNHSENWGKSSQLGSAKAKKRDKGYSPRSVKTSVCYYIKLMTLLHLIIEP